MGVFRLVRFITGDCWRLAYALGSRALSFLCKPDHRQPPDGFPPACTLLATPLLCRQPMPRESLMPKAWG